MSHYKPYPAYRDSGVEWIGPVPEYWAVKRIQDIAATQRADLPPEGGIRCASPRYAGFGDWCDSRAVFSVSKAL